ncbi:MAG: hypothetical protein IJ061_05195, partial [Lachnospiraceae bacterium]|nr:hypothetical protein [Lachnospiraceae bacterium]
MKNRVTTDNFCLSGLSDVAAGQEKIKELGKFLPKRGANATAEYQRKKQPLHHSVQRSVEKNCGI